MDRDVKFDFMKTEGNRDTHTAGLLEDIEKQIEKGCKRYDS